MRTLLLLLQALDLMDNDTARLARMWPAIQGMMSLTPAQHQMTSPCEPPAPSPRRSASLPQPPSELVQKVAENYDITMEWVIRQRSSAQDIRFSKSKTSLKLELARLGIPTDVEISRLLVRRAAESVGESFREEEEEARLRLLHEPASARSSRTTSRSSSVHSSRSTSRRSSRTPSRNSSRRSSISTGGANTDITKEVTDTLRQAAEQLRHEHTSQGEEEEIVLEGTKEEVVLSLRASFRKLLLKLKRRKKREGAPLETIQEEGKPPPEHPSKASCKCPASGPCRGHPRRRTRKVDPIEAPGEDPTPGPSAGTNQQQNDTSQTRISLIERALKYLNYLQDPPLPPVSRERMRALEEDKEKEDTRRAIRKLQLGAGPQQGWWGNKPDPPPKFRCDHRPRWSDASVHLSLGDIRLNVQAQLNAHMRVTANLHATLRANANIIVSDNRGPQVGRVEASTRHPPLQGGGLAARPLPPPPPPPPTRARPHVDWADVNRIRPYEYAALSSQNSSGGGLAPGQGHRAPAAFQPPRRLSIIPAPPPAPRRGSSSLIGPAFPDGFLAELRDRIRTRRGSDTQPLLY